MPDLNCPMFFLGSTTPKGFSPFFDTVYGLEESWRVYILKGGPGTGKSTLLSKTAAMAIAAGKEVQIIPCSGNPDSLDAVILPKAKAFVLDGTAPHVMEPNYPGVCENIVNLGEFYDSDKLFRQRDKIIPLFKENAALNSRARRYISAAGSLVSDSYRIALDYTDTEKAVRFAGAFAKRELPSKKGEAHETFRLLSAITPYGSIFFEHTLHSLCDRVIAIEDEYGAASRVIMSTLRSAFLNSGYSIITCPCPMAPDESIDHIIVPEASFAVCTSNRYHKVEKATRRIHSRRFTDMSALRSRKQRLSFNRRAIKELMISACEILHDANSVHDKLEKYYIDAMDFKGVEKTQNKIVESILSL